MQVCSYIQRFSENSLPYSNLLYPTYPTNKSEAIYMSAVAAFLYMIINQGISGICLLIIDSQSTLFIIGMVSDIDRYLCPKFSEKQKIWTNRDLL